MKARVRVLLLFIFSGFLNVSAQGTKDPPPAGSYNNSPNPCAEKENHNRRPVPKAYIREADIMWSKRVWRTIDLREKLNHPLYYPMEPDQQCRKSLFDVLKVNIMTGQLTAYGNPVMDDEFRQPLSKSEADDIFIIRDTVDVYPLDGEEEIIRTPVVEELSSQDIKQYWVKEDWVFDKERSILEVRIIGICPLKESRGEDGEFRGYQPLFWVYFPALRPILAQEEVYNRFNDVRLTYDDLFWKRMFGSFIHKASNVYDRSIFEYKFGLDALLEGEDIKNDIFTYEHDLWHY